MDQNPNISNPSSGYIVSCNNRINPRTIYFNSIGTTVPTTFRAWRAEKIINNFMEKGGKITLNDMKEMQNDTIDYFGDKLAEIVVYLVKTHKEEYLFLKWNQ